MKRKTKPNGHADGEWSDSMLARLCGVSRQYIQKRLAAGKTPREIVFEVEQQRQRRELIEGLPVVPVPGLDGTNGNGANGDYDDAILPYGIAQARKETWLSRIREVEYHKLTHELIPVKWVQNWASHFLIQAKQALAWGASELRDQLAAESDPRQCERILAEWTSRALSHLRTMQVRFEAPPEESPAD
jgi:hypothetical protein